jgi:hypothetical protein
MTLLRLLGNRAPVYDLRFEDMIKKLTVTQGGQAGTSDTSTRYVEAKFFMTRYEIYMFCVFHGIKNNYKLTIPDGSQTTKFIEIKYWKPDEIRDYLIMSIIGLSDINLIELDSMNEDELSKIATKLKTDIEQYANGGFSLLQNKYDENNEEFSFNENVFIEML